jgi:site-specific DNA recombinase
MIHQSAYSGVHVVKINGGQDYIERKVPAIVAPDLQERAKAMLIENKRHPERERDRKYLLTGLVKCAACGYAFTGHSTKSKGKKYHYYGCTVNTQKLLKRTPHRPPFLNAQWLEDLVWQDVKRFLENPGEILKRVREQLRSNDDTEELIQRREDLAKRLAAKQAEKDRYVRLYAQGHISESELDTYLTDLKNQISNLRLLIEAVETDLSQRRERTELAQMTHVWLATLRERINEVEEDTQEAFRVRRQLVRLLVGGVTVAEKREDGSTNIRITYRFDPPDGWDEEEDSVVGGVQNPSGWFRPTTRAAIMLTNAW